MGRTITNYLLLINNLPPFTIYDLDKKYYYASIEKFDKENDIKSLVLYFKYEIENTWEKTLDKVKKLKGKR